MASFDRELERRIDNLEERRLERAEYEAGRI
jgi:hypothetical protein